MSSHDKSRRTVPSYAEIAEQTFGTLWQEAQPADWALIVHYMRTAPRPSQLPTMAERPHKLADEIEKSLSDPRCNPDSSETSRTLTAGKGWWQMIVDDLRRAPPSPLAAPESPYDDPLFIAVNETATREEARRRAISECADMVKEYDDQNECGDLLVMLETNMRALAGPYDLTRHTARLAEIEAPPSHTEAPDAMQRAEADFLRRTMGELSVALGNPTLLVSPPDSMEAQLVRLAIARLSATATTRIDDTQIEAIRDAFRPFTEAKAAELYAYRAALEAIISGGEEVDAVAIAHTAITPFTPWVPAGEETTRRIDIAPTDEGAKG